MKKIKITQLENEPLSKVEQLALQGGAGGRLCGCMITEEEYDFRNTVSLNGTAPWSPGGGGSGPRPIPIGHDPA